MCSGASTKGISCTLEALLESKHILQKMSSITKKAWRERSLQGEDDRDLPLFFLNETFLKAKRKGMAREKFNLLSFGEQ
ncbi:MAG: hypothetical protein QXO75_06300 [Nitrososphaerota archaeon]